MDSLLRRTLLQKLEVVALCRMEEIHAFTSSTTIYCSLLAWAKERRVKVASDGKGRRLRRICVGGLLTGSLDIELIVVAFTAAVVRISSVLLVLILRDPRTWMALCLKACIRTR